MWESDQNATPYLHARLQLQWRCHVCGAEWYHAQNENMWEHNFSRLQTRREVVSSRSLTRRASCYLWTRTSVFRHDSNVHYCLERISAEIQTLFLVHRLIAGTTCLWMAPSKRTTHNHWGASSLNPRRHEPVCSLLTYNTVSHAFTIMCINAQVEATDNNLSELLSTLFMKIRKIQENHHNGIYFTQLKYKQSK